MEQKVLPNRKCKSFARKHDLKISFPGKLKKKEWAKLSTGYDVFLNTTYIDNTPISVIEAMALGLAVVSTNVGGMEDLVSNNVDGVLVPSGDEKAMYEAIDHLIENPLETVAMTLKAREKVTEFDWEIVKEEWNRLLQ